jgi:predicted phosphohydrolase
MALVHLKVSPGKIYWNKAIFQDKNDLLIQTMKKIETEGSMTKGLNDYKIKKITNMLKALKPVMFEVVPNNQELEGFDFYIITENNEIDMIFKIIFFYNIGFAKEVLNYKG